MSDDYRARRPSSPASGTRWSSARTRVGARRQLPAQSRGDRRWSTRCPARATSWSAPPARCPATCTSCGARATRKGYHVEYGYSCMGYEIAGGLGVKLAAPDREVFVMVGDGSYLMMARSSSPRSRRASSSSSCWCRTTASPRSARCRSRWARSASARATGTAARDGRLDGDMLPVDLAANAASLGADVIRAATAGRVQRCGQGGQGHRRAPPSSTWRPTRWSRAGQRVLVGRAGQRGLGAGLHPRGVRRRTPNGRRSSAR